MFKKIILLMAVFSFLSCKASKPAISITKAKQKAPVSLKKTASKPRKQSEDVLDYIAQYKETAMANMRTYGIPASIILAQGILESGAGKSDLAAKSNNHFGIKCNKDWAGDTIHYDDDALQECFRKYNDPAESYRDHALFLTTKTRYASLFALEKSDYKAWAYGLKQAGYATDVQYPTKLIDYIERYGLNQYDATVLGIPYVPIIYETLEPEKKEVEKTIENPDFYEVQKGDTIYAISKKYNLTITQLQELNNLTSESVLAIGQLLKIK
jgi:LysM repeat protein